MDCPVLRHHIIMPGLQGRRKPVAVSEKLNITGRSSGRPQRSGRADAADVIIGYCDVAKDELLNAVERIGTLRIAGDRVGVVALDEMVLIAVALECDNI